MKNIKKYIKIILQSLVSVIAFYYLFNKFNIDLISTLRNNNIWFILLACAIRIFISPLIYVNRWKLFLENIGVQENFWSLLKISMMSSFFGLVLPSSQGADAVRMYLIEQRHPEIREQKKAASSTILIERMIGFILLALLSLIFSLLLEYPNKKEVTTLIFVINCSLWLIVFILTNKQCYTLFSRYAYKINKFHKVVFFIDKIYCSLTTFPYRKVLFSSIILIMLFQLCTVLIVYLVFLSFGVTLQMSQHLAFYPIISILSIIPITISGLGLRESFFVSFYSLLGVEPSIAVSVSLINYLIETIMFALFGGVVYALKSLNIIKV